MAANWATKQTGFVQRYAAAVQALLNDIDQLTLLDAEFTNDAYGSGGANALTDVIVEGVLPAASALTFDEAEGAVVAVLATVSANRGYLEIMRP
jgi:hypothetical protein